MLLLLATCLVILAGAPLPHLDGDDKFYGDIARHILASGDWMTLQDPGQPWWIVDKPPLSFWFMAISIRLGGDTEAALRFWQLLMAVVAIVVTFRIARLGAGREDSLLAALFLGTSVQFFYLSLNPKQDIPLSLFLALAFYAYLVYRRGGGTRAAVASGTCAALAVLSKGIVAFAVFALVVAVDWARSRSAKDTGDWRWAQIAAGVAAFVLVAAPWFLVGAVRQGRPFIDTFFLGGTLGVGRFFRGVTTPLPYWQAVLVEIPTVMLGMVPWTGFLPGAVREAWRSLREGPPSVRLCTLWSGGYFLLAALSPADKMMHHLLPIFVPTAVLMARGVMTTLSDARRLRVPAAVALVAVVPAVATVMLTQARYPEETRFYLPIVGPSVAMLLVALLAFVGFALRGRGRMAVAVACAAILLAYGWGERTLMKFRNLPLERPQGRVARALLPAPDGDGHVRNTQRSGTEDREQWR